MPRISERMKALRAMADKLKVHLSYKCIEDMLEDYSSSSESEDEVEEVIMKSFSIIQQRKCFNRK